MFPWLQGITDNGTLLVSLNCLNRGDVAMAMISAGHAHKNTNEGHTIIGDQFPLLPEIPVGPFQLRVTFIGNGVVYGHEMSKGER